MDHALRQSGFGLVVLYCLLRLHELLWAHTKYPFMLNVVMLAAVCYLIPRAIQLYQQGIRLTLGEQGVAALVGVLGFSLVAQYAFIGTVTDKGGIDTFSYTITLLVTNLFWLLAGGAMSMRTLGYSTLRVVVILGILFVILNNARGEDILFVDYGSIVATSELESLSHLNVAEFVVLLIFVCYASVKRLQLVVFALGVLALFMLGGRSSLYFSIFAVGVFEMLRGGAKSIITLAGLGIAIGILFFIALQAGVIDEDNKFVQQILFVDGLEEDQSYLERQYISDNAPRYLPEQFLFGNPRLIAENFGDIGSYLHNLLSAWQFFGFPAFAVMSALLVACCMRMRTALREHSGPLVVFGSLLLIYTVVSILLSKFVGFRLLWISIGFWMLQPNLSFERERRVKRRSRSRRRSSWKAKFRGQSRA